MPIFNLTDVSFGRQIASSAAQQALNVITANVLERNGTFVWRCRRRLTARSVGKTKVLFGTAAEALIKTKVLFGAAHEALIK